MVNGFGALGQPAQEHVELELEPELKMVALAHSMQGCHAVVMEQRQRAVKACQFYPSTGHFKYFPLIVEGSWTTWSSWGTCSSTCGTGTQSRTRSYTGGLPCNGSSSDSQNCQSKTITTCQLTCQIISLSPQLKGHGRLGVHGVLAVQHVIQGLGQGRGLTQEDNHAQASIQTQQTAKVKMRALILWDIVLLLPHISVEGTWSTWNAWGICSGTCNSDATWTRTRNFAGGTNPCLGGQNEIGACLSEVYAYLKEDNRSYMHHFTVEGSWEPWNAWGTCSGTCDSDATWTRTRSSTGGNTPCSGSASEISSCTSMSLKKRYSMKMKSYIIVTFLVEGSWEIWNAWGTCSGTCNSDATWTRTRSSSGGNTPCSGSASETGSCLSKGYWKFFLCVDEVKISL